jgi:DNA-binding transcriptional ArsR family regulator
MAGHGRVIQRPGLDRRRYFNIFGNVESKTAVRSLGALAQETRLEVFRLLVRQGPQGLPAGAIGRRLGVPGPTLSFHLSQLGQAGLVRARREGREVHYAADYDGMAGLMRYLTENCCAGEDECGEAPTPRVKRSGSRGRSGKV